MSAAHSLQASCGPRPHIQVSIGARYAVQYLNLEGTARARFLAQLLGDTRLILRNDFSMADTFQEPAWLMVTLAGSFSFPKLPLGARCLPHCHTCRRKHEGKKRIL